MPLRKNVFIMFFFLIFVTVILTNTHQYSWKYYQELVRVVLLKMNYSFYSLKNTNSHYLLLNITIPLHNDKISQIF